MIDYETLRDGPKRRSWTALSLYGQSKFGNIVVSNEFARRYGDKIVSISLHPGGIKTNLGRHSGFAFKIVVRSLCCPAQQMELLNLTAMA